MKANTNHLLRFTGFAGGAVLAVGLVLSGRMPESRAEAPARLSITARPTSELGVAPAGVEFLATRRLLPGGRPARGRVAVSNFTGRRQSLRLRVSSAQRELDSVVRIDVRAGGPQVFEGRLAELRSWTRGSLEFRPRGRRKVEFRAWVPISVKSGYQGRSADLELEWKKARS